MSNDGGDDDSASVIDDGEEEQDEATDDGEEIAAKPAQPTGTRSFDVSDDSLSEEDLHTQSLKARLLDAEKKKKQSKSNGGKGVKCSTTASVTARPTAEVHLQGISEYLSRKAERVEAPISADQQFLMGLLEDLSKVPEEVKAQVKCAIITSIDQAKRLTGQFAPAPAPVQQQMYAPPAPLPATPRQRVQQQAQPMQQYHNQNQQNNYIRGHYGGFMDALVPLPAELNNVNDLNGVNLDDIYFTPPIQPTPVSVAGNANAQQQQQQ